MQHAWTCPCCGRPQHSLPLDIGARTPDPWREADQADRDAGFLGSDLCYLGPRRFLRVCLEIPIRDHTEIFNYGVWVSLSEPNFERIRSLWDVPVPQDEPSKFAWLCTEIAEYPGSHGLKGCIWLRDDNKRPRLALEPTDHPLSRAQRDGITLADIERLAARYLPPHRATGRDGTVQKRHTPETPVSTGSNPIAS